MSTILTKRQNPFPGLRSFEPEESDRFFGRSVQIQDILEKLRHNRFISVIGTSGSGKSSLVKGGVLPQLEQSDEAESWNILHFRPEGQPIRNLAAKLASLDRLYIDEDDEVAYLEVMLQRGRQGLVQAVEEMELDRWERLLIVVDQFEELFRFQEKNSKQSSEESLPTRFVNLLLTATQQTRIPVYVMITMRSDFLGDCAAIHGLPEAINAGQYLIPRMTREELQEVITGPLNLAGYQYPISNVLVNRLLFDLDNKMDMLPILQHALMRTWHEWDHNSTEGEIIGVKHYEAIGTMRHALSNHADEAYLELDDEGKKVCGLLFRALTEITKDGRGIRNPTKMQLLIQITQANAATVRRVIEAFRKEGRGFLMPPEGSLEENTKVDISHESLMREWVRLKEWNKEEYEHVQIYLRLVEAARLNNQGKAGLYRSPELDVALRWHHQNQITAEWAERYDKAYVLAINFLEKSQEEKQLQQELEERERRRKLNRVIFIAIIIGVAALAAIGFGVFAKQKEKDARNAEKEAMLAKGKAEWSSIMADQEKIKALIAKQDADYSASVAEAQRILAITAATPADSAAGAARTAEARARQAESAALLAAKSDSTARVSADSARDVALFLRRLSVQSLRKSDSLAFVAKIEEGLALARATASESVFIRDADPAGSRTLAKQALKTLQEATRYIIQFNLSNAYLATIPDTLRSDEVFEQVDQLATRALQALEICRASENWDQFESIFDRQTEDFVWNEPLGSSQNFRALTKQALAPYRYNTPLQHNTLFEPLLALWQKLHPRSTKSLGSGNVTSITQAYNHNGQAMFLAQSFGQDYYQILIQNNGLEAHRLNIPGRTTQVQLISSNEALGASREAWYSYSLNPEQNLSIPYQPKAEPGQPMHLHGSFSTLSSNKEIKVFHYEGGLSSSLLSTVPVPAGEKVRAVFCQQPQQTPLLYAVLEGRDGNLKIRTWNLKDSGPAEELPLFSFNDKVSAIGQILLRVHPKGEYVAICWERNFVVLAPNMEQPVFQGSHNQLITDLAFSNDIAFPTLATTSHDNTLRIWPLYTSNQAQSIWSPFWQEEPLVVSLPGKSIYSVAFPPDSQAVLLGGQSGELRLIPIQLQQIYSQLR
ncbi:MAG TPA: hypothetical protein DCP28_30300 [Cytophagales bacterium]|nr:hypothetical protein [Cytophagales bacterium]